MTNSSINTTNPISISSGGTGVSSFAHTNGTVIYNGTTLTSISPGTVGQVLLSNGSSAPSFQTVAGSGEWILLQTLTANNSASLVFTSISSTYSTYALVLDNLLTTASTSAYLQLLMSTNGGSTYISSYTGGLVSWIGGITGAKSASDSGSILLNDTAASTPASPSNAGTCGTLYIYNPATNTSGIYPSVVGSTVYAQQGIGVAAVFTQVYAATTSDSENVNAIQLIYSGSNPIVSGYASLYALVQ